MPQLMFRIYFCVFAFLLPLTGVSPAGAEQVQKQPEQEITVLPQVEVTAKRTDRLTVSDVLDKSILEDLPSRNGNITDKLTILPGVQAAENFNNSRQGGEITPAELSISGGRVHSNNYLLDGVSTSSLLDPGFKNTSNIDNIPGHSQELFLLDNIIQDISVRRANISARYGSFTGGVVEINTIEPDIEFGGEVEYRTTRSQWTQFHIHPEARDDFKNAVDVENQSEFTKHQTGFVLHVPLTEKIGTVFGYSRLQASIPLTQFGEAKKQHRRNENIFFKTVATPQAATKLSFSGTYAPFAGDYFNERALRSDYTLKSGGYTLTGKLEHQLAVGDVEFSLSYNESENSRKAPDTWWTWRSTESKNWGKTVSLEGGSGDLEKREATLATGLHLALEPLPTGALTHQLNVGLELDRTKAHFDRTEVLTRYLGAKEAEGAPLNCNGNSAECVDDEQFFYLRNLYPVDSVHAEISNYQAYLEDNIEISRLTLRPGLRISYNDYQSNTDVAPRIALAYDLLGDQQTVFVGGFNRYYGTNLLTLQLEEEKAASETQCRGDLRANGSCDTQTAAYSKPWVTTQRTFINASRISDLNTPYSDEYTLGIKQALLGGQLEVHYIDRTFKDQIVSIRRERDENGFVYKEWSNAGRRHHKEASLSWQRSWAKHHLAFNVTWQETKSNSSSYLDSFRTFSDPAKIDELEELVYYDGKLVKLKQLPLNNYNRPWKGSLIYTAELPYGFSFSNTTHYRSRYERVDQIRRGIVRLPNGTMVDAKDLDYDYYGEVTRPSALIFDWLLTWRSADWNGQRLELNLEILNLLNEKVEVGNADDEFLLGRQFWAGLKYTF